MEDDLGTGIGDFSRFTVKGWRCFGAWMERAASGQELTVTNDCFEGA